MRISDSHHEKAEISRIIESDLNARGFVEEWQYEIGPTVFGMSHRTLTIHFTYYEEIETMARTKSAPVEEPTPEPAKMFKATITFIAEPGVTADQVKDMLENGNCGDFDGLVDDIQKVKVKEIAEEVSPAEAQ